MTTQVLSRTWIGRYGVPKEIKATSKMDIGWSVLGTNLTFNKIVEAKLPYIMNATIIEGKDVVISQKRMTVSEGTYIGGDQYYPPSESSFNLSIFHPRIILSRDHRRLYHALSSSISRDHHDVIIVIIT